MPARLQDFGMKNAINAPDNRKDKNKEIIFAA
jgi:hypothetical protein